MNSSLLPRTTASAPAEDSLNVLMIAQQFRPLTGGYERAAERLSTTLAQLGHHVVVITERRTREWPASESLDGFLIHRLPCLYRPHVHMATSLLSFAGFLLLHGRRFDIWHVHQYGFHAALAIALGKLLGRPVVLKLTSSGSMGIAAALGKTSSGRLLRHLHRRVDACLAVSAETASEATGFGIPAKRVFRIPNGLDGTHFRPSTTTERADLRASLGLSCRLLVLNVGRLSSEKNPLGLLEAWAHIPAALREGALLVLVGDGPDRHTVEARAKQQDLSGSVFVPGKREDVSVWFRAADCYAIASLNEGLSNSMIEALACGLPIASTTVSGVTEYVVESGAGTAVPVGDIHGLATEIGRLLAAPELRATRGRMARRAFEQHLSMNLVASRIVALYRSCIEGIA